jgi:radical SAM superfamily enzyme YgiQ (UPF0313 family)
LPAVAQVKRFLFAMAVSNNNQNKGKRVLILFPPFHDNLYGGGWRRSESPFAPLGLNYLATPLVKAGYNVNIIDLQVDHLNEVLYFDSFRNIDYVLISCFTFAFTNIQKIIRDIKITNDRAVIICGGPLCNETQKHIDNADVTVFGEADLIIAELLELISGKSSLKDIPGLSYMLDGRLVRNPGILQVENLDALDIPLLDLTADKDYGYLYGIRFNKIIPVITTRGCAFRCTFCTYQNVKYRERSVENVMQEIKMRVSAGAKYIVFCDDNFLLHPARANEIFDNIIECKLKVKIIIQGRVDIIDHRLALKMKQANVIILIFGIESVNQDVLNFYNKRTTVEKITEVIRIINSVGIISISGIIIGAPFEERRHFENITEFFNKVPQDFINVNILRYQHPSPLWVQANRKGLIRDDQMLVRADEKLSNFSYETLLMTQNKIIRSFYNNPARIARIIYKVSRQIGIFMFFRMLVIYFSKSIYRPPQEFHR